MLPTPRATSLRSVSIGAAALSLWSCSQDPSTPPVPATPCQALQLDGGGITIGSGLPGDPASPRPPTFYRPGKTVVTARTYMVVTSNPLASRTGCEILEAGGTAADAAIAAQMVLGLVEPQTSGIGGGAFLLYYDAKANVVHAYDGRETAPAAASENYLRFVTDVTDQTSPRPNPRSSGRSIGTPGVLRLLELAHHDHGRLAWSDLFSPAIRLANDGFPIGGLLGFAIETSTSQLLADPEAAATYYNPDGTARQLGSTLRVPAYAATLTAIAAGGAYAFYHGDLAQAIVDKIQTTQSASGTLITPGATTLADLAGYQAVRRDAICVGYRAYVVCGMPPPSSGGIAVGQTLGILENFDLAGDGPSPLDPEGGTPQVEGVHLIAEAERLAYADRDKYVADTDFVALPGGTPNRMLDKAYLHTRAGLISLTTSLGTATAGDLGGAVQGVDRTPEHGTSHITIVDPDGDALVMTTTVESTFGSYHMTHGFLLNNQLTDFSATPSDATGAPIANRVAGGKRPRSSMSPTLVFRAAADGSRASFVMATGSPGGATIIQFVVKTLVGVLDWGLDAQQATSLVDFGAANDPTTNVGGEHPDVDPAGDALIQGLRARGHLVNTAPQTSGIGAVIVTPSTDGSVLTGGADPRREGIVLGDAYRP